VNQIGSKVREQIDKLLKENQLNSKGKGNFVE
jgi:hypothetical protein